MDRLRSTRRAVLDPLGSDTMSDRGLWLAAFVPVAVLFLACAHWSVVNVDAAAAAWPGWALVHHHTLHLDGVTDLPFDPWFVQSHGHLVSSRMPGVVFIGVPLQALLSWTTASAVTISTITAALVTAAAVANVAVLIRGFASARVALAAAAILAFGSSLWTTAGAELWTHGPDALWLSAAMLALNRGRHLLASTLVAAAILTRPHLAVVALTIGLALAVHHRQLRQLAIFGLPSAAALGLVELYNLYLFGQASIGGGTYEYAADRALAGVSSGNTVAALRAWATSLAGLMMSPKRGLLFYSPIVAIAIPAVRHGWRAIPAWCKGATIGGVAYLLLQAKLNSFEGGAGFYGSRLTIEPLVLWMPLVVLSVRQVWERGYRTPVIVTCWLSVAIGLVGATMGHVVTPYFSPPWTTWVPIDVVRSSGPAAIPVVGTIVAALPLLLLLARRTRSRTADPTSRPSPAERAAATTA